jgi:hypothetical protein
MDGEAAVIAERVRETLEQGVDAKRGFLARTSNQEPKRGPETAL